MNDDSKPNTFAALLGLVPGSVIAGSYRVLGHLGRGGMGIVLHAEDVNLEREVALKVIRPEFVADPKARAGFVHEARTMARIRHENVVAIHAYGELEGIPYFAMEYFAEGSLEDRLDPSAPRLSEDEALGFLDQICRGVSAIHKSGAAHHDLKPSNVLVGPAFRVAISDLGLARVLGQQALTKDGVPGTPTYLAPEVIRGDALDPSLLAAADVYALGVMSYELLTGELPFHAPGITELIRMHLRDTPRLPSSIKPELGTRYDEVLLHALSKDPSARTRSVEEFRAALWDAREERATEHPISVLIVDDDADFQRLASEVLGLAFQSAHIVTARDGTEALQRIEQAPVSLVVLDLDMPGMNGVDLTRALRESDATREVPIIVATGVGGGPDWKLLQSMGANGFLVKPVDPIALVRLARRLVGAEL